MWFRSALDFLRLESPGRGRRRRHRQQASRLLLEILEDRTVPSFLPPVDYPVNRYTDALAMGDFRNDGIQDLVACNDAGWNTVSVLLGNGDGTFQAPTVVPLPDWSPPGYSGAPLGQGCQAVVVGDLNKDGKLDLAVTATSAYSVYGGSGYYTSVYTKVYASVNVLLGNGDGTFTDSQIIPLNGTTPQGIVTGDFNGDTLPDLAVSDGSGGTVSVLLNAGASNSPASNFAVSGFPSSTTAGVPESFTVTALNADGTIDTNFSGTVYFTSSDGQATLPANYTFTPADGGVHAFSATLKSAGTQSLTATAGGISGSETGITVTPAQANHLDVSANSNSDATAGTPFSITVTARDPYNNVASGYAGTVSFTSSDAQASLPGAYTFSNSDAGVHTFTNGAILDTAGWQSLTARDTVTASITGSATVGVLPAPASKMIISGFSSPITAGTAGSFTVTLEDPYGNIASGYRDTLHFTSSDAKAVLPANYAFTYDDAGVHTFSATLKTAGTQSITATDTATASLNGMDAGIAVNPAAASKFILTAPASVNVGASFSLTLAVEDAYGNIVTNYTGTAHFSSSDTKATLPANYTFKTTDKGVHTFTGLVLRTKGYQKIKVVDTHNSSLTMTVTVDVL